MGPAAAQLVACGRQLRKLSLFNSRLGDEGAFKVAELAASEALTALLELELSACGIGAPGMQSLFGALQTGVAPALEVMLLLVPGAGCWERWAQVLPRCRCSCSPACSVGGHGHCGWLTRHALLQRCCLCCCTQMDKRKLAGAQLPCVLAASSPTCWSAWVCYARTPYTRQQLCGLEGPYTCFCSHDCHRHGSAWCGLMVADRAWHQAAVIGMVQFGTAKQESGTAQAIS